MEWSTKNVLKETLASLIKKELSFYILPKLHDIDTMEDLLYICSRIQRGFKTGKRTELKLKTIMHYEFEKIKYQ
jgi:glycosyltransferase A (GT-A) superfamily protein (DUF2064 family)